MCTWETHPCFYTCKLHSYINRKGWVREFWSLYWCLIINGELWIPMWGLKTVTVPLELARHNPRYQLHQDCALPQNGFHWLFLLNMKVKIKSKSCVGDNWMINSLSPHRADKQHPLYLSSDGLLLLMHLSPRLTLQAFQNVGKCPLEVLSAVLL